MPSELEQFLDATQDQNPKVDLLEQEIRVPGEAEGSPEKDTEPQEPRNRAERRERARGWERRLDDREKEIIAREARIQAIAELQAQNAPKDVPEEWLRMFGDKPETREAWRLQTELNRKEFDSFKQEIRNELLEEQRAALQEEQEAQDELQDILDSVEDKYNVNFSSSRERNRYLEALTKVSHKNADGEVDVFGDPDAAYELYTLTREKSPTSQRSKDLASRAVAPSGEVNVPKAQDAALRDYLRSEGINI